MSISRDPIVEGPQRTVAEQTAYRQLKMLGIGTFNAYKSAAQDNIASATWTKVTFDTEEYDVSDWYANDKYTPDQRGFYRLTACVNITPAVADKYVILSCYKNGSRYQDFGMVQTPATDAVTVSGSVIVKADGDDYFEVYIYHNFGVDTSDLPAPTTQEIQFFQGELISQQGS